MANIWSAPPSITPYLKENVLLGPMTWLRTGGIADVFWRPKDIDELQQALRCLAPNAPLHVLGAGSNSLIRDKGLRGLTIKLGKSFRTLEHTEHTVTVGAAYPLPDLSVKTAKLSLFNLGFYVGIPGTVGGAIRMNAGAHNQTTADVLLSCKTIDRYGMLHTFTRKDITFKHRFCSLPSDHIIISGTFSVLQAPHETCKEHIQKCLAYRDATQPKNVATCGCTFKNPEGHHAWALIKNSGVDIHTGAAQMSEKHANFLINAHNATAEDLECLITKIEVAVLKNSGIQLEREIKIIGDK